MADPGIDLKGKTALVTGSSRGIGRAIALAFGRCGAQVFVHYHRRTEAANEVVQMIESSGAQARAIQADMGHADEIKQMFDEVRSRTDEQLDILVNNAGGIGSAYPLAEMPKDVWDKMLATNLTAIFLCTQAAWSMLPDQTGRILNVTSISARTGGGPNATHYAAAKGAMNNFTRACAKEFAPRGITVNGIAPGVIYTDLHKENTPQQQLDELKNRIPLGRLGEAGDIAGTALLLCSAHASYITGEIIEINGGLLMN